MDESINKLTNEELTILTSIELLMFSIKLLLVVNEQMVVNAEMATGTDLEDEFYDVSLAKYRMAWDQYASTKSTPEIEPLLKILNKVLSFGINYLQENRPEMDLSVFDDFIEEII